MSSFLQSRLPEHSASPKVVFASSLDRKAAIVSSMLMQGSFQPRDEGRSSRHRVRTFFRALGNKLKWNG